MEAMPAIHLGPIVPYMTIETFSKGTGASLETIRAWIREGKIPSLKVGKRRMVNTARLWAEALAQEE